MIRVIIYQYEWQAKAQRDPRVYLCKEYVNGEEVNIYAIHQDRLGTEIMRVVKEEQSK